MCNLYFWEFINYNIFFCLDNKFSKYYSDKYLEPNNYKTQIQQKKLKYYYIIYKIKQDSIMYRSYTENKLKKIKKSSYVFIDNSFN